MTTILVVEDDFDIRESFTDLLKGEGYDILEAANGLEGIQTLELNVDKISLVLLDSKMSVMNGEQFRYAQLAHPDPRVRTMPVIVVSATHWASLGDKHWIKDTGLHIVKKPFDSDHVLREIKAALDAAS